MMMYNIVITNPAENDLYEIGRYISTELLEPETAQRVISRIADAITNLENMPYRNVLVNDTRLAEEIKTVTIIRVLYNRRDWQGYV